MTVPLNDATSGTPPARIEYRQVFYIPEVNDNYLGEGFGAHVPGKVFATLEAAIEAWYWRNGRDKWGQPISREAERQAAHRGESESWLERQREKSDRKIVAEIRRILAERDKSRARGGLK